MILRFGAFARVSLKGKNALTPPSIREGQQSNKYAIHRVNGAIKM